ncbi:MAG: RNA-binding domain-containing protein [candidate division KSB1 bacterium]
MDAQELQNLIAAGESDAVEFKEHIAGKWKELKTKLAIAICAMANTDGGTVLVGVSDNGGVTGVEEEQTLFEEKLKDILHTGFNFPITAQLHRTQVGDKWIQEVKVRKYRGPEPLTYQKHIYVRRGASSVEQSPHERQELFNVFGFFLTEDQIIPNSGLTNINPEKFKNYLSRFGIDVIDDPQPSFEQDLLNREVLSKQFQEVTCTLYGLLCFGYSPQQFLPFAAVELSTYNGLTRADDILFTRTCGGTVQEQIESAVAAVRELYRFENFDELVRRDEFLLPLGALRELVANAVVHRDYNISGSKILIDIFHDRVEITSPGELPNSLTPAKILSGGIIRSRNEKMANFLLAMGLVESRGRGIPRVRKLMRDYNGTGLEIENDREVRFVRATLRIR